MPGAITTETLAATLGAELRGRGDIALSDLAGIDEAAAGCLTFIRSAEYARKWPTSNASAAIVSRGIEVPGHDPERRALLIVENADRAVVSLLAELHKLAAPPPPPAGIHPSAIVDPSADIHPSAAVGPLCVVGPAAAVAEGVVLHARVTLGANVRLGARTVIHPGVVVYHACVIGSGCILHANASIGADGFGYIPHPAGQGLVKVPHLSNVVIGDNVEIGAGSCIDRGKFRPTRIGDGVKIDNLVQVGHNVTVGPHAVLCGQVGIGGSATIGAGVMLGGQAGVGDNRAVGPGAKIGAQSGVLRDIEAGRLVFGTPARPSSEAFRAVGASERALSAVRDLKRRLAQLESRINAPDAQDARP